MKNVLIVTLVLFVGWCVGCPLYAQSCQPNPACKAICSSAKAEKANAATASLTAPAEATTAKKSCLGASNRSSVAGVQVIPAGLLDPGTVSQKSDAKNCDPKNCDPGECDWSKCDWRKCQPANCSPKGSKSAAVRL